MRKIIAIIILAFVFVSGFVGATATATNEANTEVEASEEDGESARCEPKLTFTTETEETPETEPAETTASIAHEDTSETEATAADNSEESTLSNSILESNDDDIYSIVQQEVLTSYVTEIAVLSGIVFSEARGCSIGEKACVVWCVLNRVDYYGSDILSIALAPHQFATGDYYDDECESIVIDVLTRYFMEKRGYSVVRELPSNYKFYEGDGTHNWFHTSFTSNDYYCYGIS